MIHWSQIYSGVWRAEVGDLPAFTPLGLLDITPRSDALAELGDVPFPFEDGEPSVINVSPGSTALRFPLSGEERIYGLGLHFKRLNHRGNVMRLQVDHYGGRDDGRSHASMPFYVSGAGYAVLLNTARVVTADLGTSVRKDDPNRPPSRDRNTDDQWDASPPADAVEMSVPEGGVEILVFGGPTALDAVRRYNLFCGGGVLPPRWALGFWHRVPTLYTDDQIAAEVEEFEERGYPLQVVGLEPGWHSKAYPCTYEWDESRFPDPAGFVSRMAAKDIRINLWENAYVSPDAGVHDALEPLSGSHLVWGGIVPDYTMPEAREILATQHQREHVDIGVSGYKLDECDGHDHWLWPAHATFPSGRSGEEMRQTYGLQLQTLTEGAFEASGRRTFGLTRASYIGAAPLPYALYSDYYDHRAFVTALCNCGFSGLLWCPEIRSASDAEEWVRRMQTVCFSPLAMLNAWASGTKPWSYPEVEGAIREVMQLRVRLMPYLYSAFARYHFDGTPPFRSTVLEDGTVGGRSDQYMMGDSLLVAPLFTGETKREVDFPTGCWFDFYTGELTGDGGVHTVSAPLERIPVFVRDGGIVPLAGVEGSPMELRYYGTAPQGSFKYYHDDGETDAYRRGEYSWSDVQATRADANNLTGTVESPMRHPAEELRTAMWRMMTTD